MLPVTLKKNNEFLRCYKGQSFVHPLVITYVVRTKRPFVRYGITTSKKIGNAVERNRARRILKAAMPSLVGKKGYDIVFVARAATPKQTSTRLVSVLKEQLSKAGIL